ncbi:MAG: hypothetical protein GY781_07295 [Gammaproteobacteria bacterium]|nr:hypothetical protein [Gammaproteobacteria bacterium]
MVSIGILVFYGTSVIEGFLSGWSIILYLAYGVLIIFGLPLLTRGIWLIYKYCEVLRPS